MAKHAKHSKEAKKNLKQRKKRLKREREREERELRRQGHGVKRGCLVAVLVVLILVLLLGALGTIVLLRPAFAQPMLERIQPALEMVQPVVDRACDLMGIERSAQEPDEGAEAPHPTAVPSDGFTASDRQISEEAQAQQEEDQLEELIHQRRLIAQCQGVDIYSPIAQDQITGVLFHQASYPWGQVLTTELPEADLAKIYDDGEFLRVNHEQTEGEWVDADAAHLYREQDATPMDTSIDCGAPAGTAVYAPVTGEVIAVQDYMLYDEIPDVQIHIRPDSNRDVDVVLLHQYDPLVKAGDHVTAGQDQISSVRDIAKDLTDVQLSFYTEPDDPGNHSHIQVNDLHNKDYLRMYFKGVEIEGIDTSFIEEEEKAAEEAKKAEEEAEGDAE